MRADSTLTVTTCSIDLAELGPDSPLPSVQPLLEPPYLVGEGIPEEVAAGSRWGKVKNIYPYPMQDAYTRETSATELTAVVLENDHIKATFLPQLGGRLWALTDKATGKELLHTQDRIQFANLALRNAWFAGGIEFNIGTRGHSPTTCSPLHSAIVETPEGQSVLRMWEFDRLREVVFQIDAWLPADSRVVFVAVRIQNPNPETVPMYWWTNAAVPQTPATRALAPAARAYATDYDGSMAIVAPTEFHGIDATYPVRNPHAADFFFDLAPEGRRWEVAMDDAGDGLALVSSPALRGRKLFVWGENTGGHRWQEWLTPTPADGQPRHYAEIQSGLAQTQFEHVPMPGGASWQWVEAYGNAGLDPAIGNGAWPEAVEHGAQRITDLVPEAAVDAALADAARWADLAPHEMLVAGNGWGALEAVRRRSSAMNWIDETGTPFSPETLTADQSPWLELLATKDGAAPGKHPFAGSASFVRGLDWEELLAAEPTMGAESAFHLAVMAHARASAELADQSGVAQLYRTALASAELSDSSRALAHRGLGLTLLALNDPTGGVTKLAAACAADINNRWLLIEAMTHAIAVNRPEAALELAGRAPQSLSDVGRVAFLRALAHARSGEPEKAAAMLRAGLEVADLREGENSITALWQEVCPDDDVPQAYQFSMH
ncbi:DUF5107 domain-containing protein [Arthrobacter sp. GMC3]|uniref:DUF5107 domain-containing protein n=1 Tax=Arthrobacter sp. GMC3 TaxID=2058894 RepID=UPI0021581D9C|nr:DUF5107 domain-containing protein [Arthrobacter sp. GMC3]